MKLKVIDFGHAEFTNIHNLVGMRGSPFYSAPEIGNEVYDGQKTDVFSLGIMLFVAVQGRLPF